MIDQDILSGWLKASLVVHGHGSNKKAAEILGISPSALSKITNGPKYGFDQKTLNLVAWILQTKLESTQHQLLEPEESKRIEGFIFEKHEGKWYWKLAPDND